MNLKTTNPKLTHSASRASAALLAFTLLAFTLAGCDLLSNEKQQPRTVSVSLQDLQAQLGYRSDLSSPRNDGGGDFTSDPVDGLVIGAVVAQTRTRPYTTEEGLTDALRKDLEHDVTNSSDLIQIVKFPTDTDVIRLEIPEPNAGPWQIMVVAMGADSTGKSRMPKGISELEDAAFDVEFENAAKYFGFTRGFLKTDDVADSTRGIILTRNCGAPVAPSGCATYDQRGFGHVAGGDGFDDENFPAEDVVERGVGNVEVIDVIWTKQEEDGRTPAPGFENGCSLKAAFKDVDHVGEFIDFSKRPAVFPLVIRQNADSSEGEVSPKTAEFVLTALIKEKVDLSDKINTGEIRSALAGAKFFVNIYRDKLVTVTTHELSPRENVCEEEDECGKYTINFAFADDDRVPDRRQAADDAIPNLSAPPAGCGP